MGSPKTLVGSINKMQIIGPPSELPRPAKILNQTFNFLLGFFCPTESLFLLLFLLSGLANYDAATLWREGRTSKEKTLFLLLLFLGGEWTKMDSKVIHPGLVGWRVGSRDYKLGFLGGLYVQVSQNFIILLGGLVSLKLCTVSVLSKKSPPFFQQIFAPKRRKTEFPRLSFQANFRSKGNTVSRQKSS